ALRALHARDGLRPGGLRPADLRSLAHPGLELRRARARLGAGMKRLGVDFVRRARSPWPGRLLAAAALAVSLEAALSYKDLRASVALNEARLAQAQPRRAPAGRPSAEEVAAVRETVERLGMPWERLFGALESAASDQVALLGVEPDPKAGTVVISGDSK